MKMPRGSHKESLKKTWRYLENNRRRDRMDQALSRNHTQWRRMFEKCRRVKTT